MTAVAAATLSAIAVHVAAGHAAAGSVATIAVQWTHFAAVGIWIGGLAALLLGIRGAASDIKAASVRRFSTMAGVAIVVVAASGLWRAVNELASWDDLTTTAYGRAVLAKGGLLLVIAALGAINRWWNVPRAHVGLGPLRIAARGELALAASALGAAALLGTLPPPAAVRLVPGIAASGVDFGTTVRVSLSAASDQPGPNRFVARISDDDPALPTTSLLLEPGPDDAYIGSGANLSFDGRWRVTVRVERAGNSVEVPIDVETRSLPQFVSVLRVPGHAPEYTIEVKGVGHVRISPDPERAGRSTLHVTCFNPIYEFQAVDTLIVTAGARRAPARQLPVRRLDRSSFLADVDLQPGPNRIAVVARTDYGARLRAVIEIEVPRR
jgi:hypothetical protein